MSFNCGENTNPKKGKETNNDRKNEKYDELGELLWQNLCKQLQAKLSERWGYVKQAFECEKLLGEMGDCHLNLKPCSQNDLVHSQ